MQRPDTAHRTGYVVKVYPRFSETFIVTELLAREAAGEQLEVFALRPTSDTRFHPELARVKAPVRFVARARKLTEGWAVLAEASATVPGFDARFARLLPELSGYDADEVHQAAALATAAVRSGITHLHAHFASLAGRTAELASLMSGIPFSVTTHAKDLFHESVDAGRLGRMLGRAHHVVTISRYNLEHLAAAYPEHVDKVHLLYNGLELERFPFTEPRPVRGPLRIAAVGRLVEKKGFAQLLDAVAELGRRGVPAELRIAGEGELEDGLRSRAARLAGSVRAELLGACTQAEVRSLLEWADVFAAPCVVGADGNADGLPTVLLEAMAMGVPCIATSVTGIPEAVHPGAPGVPGGVADAGPALGAVPGRHGAAGPATGVLLEPGDVPALAEALEAAAGGDFDRVGLARSARALIEERFDSARQARALARLEDTAGPVAAVNAADPAVHRGPAVAGRTARPAGGERRADVPPRDLDGLRVAYVCLDPGIPVFGSKGASVHVQEIVRALRARGAAVTLYCARTGGAPPADLDGLRVVERRLGRGPAAERELAQIRASREAARRIADDGADLVYERYSLFSTVLAELGGQGVPGILEVNAPLIDEQRRHRELHHEGRALEVARAQIGAAVRTVCVSGAVADWARGHAPVGAADRVRVVANGVNTDRIRPGTGTAPSAVPTVVFVGTLKPWHGVETLIDAVAASAGRWRLRIVGDGPLRGALEDRAAALGPAAAGRVEFTGAVAPERIGPLLGDAELAAAPYPAASEAESYFSPLKIYEYLAAGLPVVGSRVGQVPGIVDDGRTGVLVEPSDAGALAAALDALAADPARREGMARAARAEAVEHHGWDRVLDRILDGLDPFPAAAPRIVDEEVSA
ncbi:glycosyltransferase [Zafaria sp. J156]|uniref:glycosyltransferase n=2 Tax=Zafaria sp. J156 TaxID=3116490 RepID=UPI003D35CBF0